VQVATETVRANAVRVDVRRADVLRDELPPVDLVVANIDLRAVRALLTRRPAGRAITSGYLAGDRPTASGWEQVERAELDGWAADVLAAS
jgi:hypothetical protein